MHMMQDASTAKESLALSISFQASRAGQLIIHTGYFRLTPNPKLKLCVWIIKSLPKLLLMPLCYVRKWRWLGQQVLSCWAVEKVPE